MNHSKRFQRVRRRRNWHVSGTVLVLTLALSGSALGQSNAPGPENTVSSPAATAPVGTGPRVEAITSMRDRPLTGKAAAIPAHPSSCDFTVTTADWFDTGVVLSAGEQATFTVTGSFTLGDGRTVGPDGLDRGWKDLLRNFPLNQARVGALVGRVSDLGASVPFSVGANGQVTVPTSGKLYLAVNTTSDLSASGSYKVKVTFAPAKIVATPAGPVTAINTVIKPEMFAEIPRRVSDSPSVGGNPGDMVNFALVGTQEQVEAAYKAAGWTHVDKSVQDAVLNGLLKTLNKESYTEMPMSTLYLFGRGQDLSYARADPLMVAAERHHLRVWKTNQLIDGKPLWVGSATHDIGFEKDQRNNGVTHKIDPEIDKEREYLLQSFDAAGAFSSAAYVTPANPMLEAKTATGGSFHSDGRIVVMELK